MHLQRQVLPQWSSGITQHHFAVGADIDHQRKVFFGIKPGRRQTAHRICADKSGDIGQYPHHTVRCNGQQLRSRQFQRLKDTGHVGRRHQRLGINAQHEMVHGRVAHDAGQADSFRLDTSLAGRLLRQFCQRLGHRRLQFLFAAVQNILDAGDHVRAELGLGIEAAGLGEHLSTGAVQQIGHYSGSTDIEGQHIGIRTVCCGFHRQAAGENHSTVALGDLHCHVPIHHSLTGEHLHTIHQDSALAAGAAAAARGIRVESGTAQRLQKTASRRRFQGLTIGQNTNLKGLQKDRSSPKGYYNNVSRMLRRRAEHAGLKLIQGHMIEHIVFQ